MSQRSLKGSEKVHGEATYTVHDVLASLAWHNDPNVPQRVAGVDPSYCDGNAIIAAVGEPQCRLLSTVDVRS